VVCSFANSCLHCEYCTARLLCASQAVTMLCLAGLKGAAKGLSTRDYIRITKFDFRESLSKHIYVSKMNSDLPGLFHTSKWHCC